MTFPPQIIPTVITESTFMKQIVLTSKVSAMWPSLQVHSSCSFIVSAFKIPSTQLNWCAKTPSTFMHIWYEQITLKTFALEKNYLYFHTFEIFHIFYSQYCQLSQPVVYYIQLNGNDRANTQKRESDFRNKREGDKQPKYKIGQRNEETF